MTTYTPNPVNTTNIKLPEELISLREKIAENTHEVWSVGRIRDGWTYGETRDDAKKHHPCLIPYEELPESEKEYDRNTAMETLKLIVALGYDIVNNQEEEIKKSEHPCDTEPFECPFNARYSEDCRYYCGLGVDEDEPEDEERKEEDC